MIDLENDDTIQIVDYVKVDMLTSGQLEIDDNILIADSIIEQSIAFEYKGIFSLKNKKEASTNVPQENAPYKPPHQKGVDFSNCIPKTKQ